MKKFVLYSLMLGALVSTTACRNIEEDGPTIIQNGGNGNGDTENLILSGKITSNTTLKANKIYKLRGLVYVTNGATLTIEPGTKIVGEADKNGALIITRGSKIMAEGTAANPIIFTSEKASPKRGDWAGVVILGNAPTNASFGGTNGVGEIEGGINNSEGLGLYGGNNAADNSGVLKYVRIEYAGYAFLPDKEINGLTFGGVGSGTTVDYVEVAYANDDSFEWFGGTVNCSHLISYKGLDDDFDTDNGYSGNVQFGIAVRDSQVADVSGSNAFESDNDANGSTLTPQTSATFSNMTIIGPINSAAPGSINALFQNALQIRRNSSISVFNSVFTGFPVGLFIDATKGSPTDNNIVGNKLFFENNVLAGNTTPLKFGPSTSTPTTYTLNDLTTWFNAKGNTILASTADVKLAGAWAPAGTTPNFTPNAGSPLLTGGAFTNPKLATWFTQVTYRGAVKDATDTWYAGWTNFNL
ncbi:MULTISPECIES: hypothetical protein [Chryseobacterium]|uniref:T9SS C-terminal target domain-containing protein n=1 Tax=Chryseobacterium cucumeris TaxID=1813611 RepID=A0ABX9X5Q4_9FLAO|nr:MULTISPECIES: hypothetical protein [Chryseobacterium]KYH05637.1 hypothetical protein A1704_11105 [Chryseobacterium cucumeris]MDH5032198.1 hypothetical protein [Chryseobacterium cucumeris]QWT85861.1 hypothetical protein KBP46_20870 [Chryseobacterium sp. PCH239]RKE82717.1 hypothetical protein DEU39_2279 [Chryseobacterium sp. AG363]ROH90467.1 hypothetical protein EGI15_17545 [Chryseobacterium cucumeris]